LFDLALLATKLCIGNFQRSYLIFQIDALLFLDHSIGCFYRGDVFKITILKAGSLSIIIHRLSEISRDTKTTFVQEAQVNLCSGEALIGSLAVPESRQRVVRLKTQTFFVDLAYVGLCFRIAALGRGQPDLQRSCEVGPVVTGVLPATNLALGSGGFHSSTRRQIGKVSAEFSYLPW